MGNTLAGIFYILFKDKQARVLMLGLDAAGKTTILNKLKLDEDIQTIPTITEYTVKQAKYKEINFTIWDVGCQWRFRPLWHHYFDDSNALILVVDSSDKERMNEVKEIVEELSKSNLQNLKLLIFANKQDLPFALNVNELEKELNLKELWKREWFIQLCCACNGNGIIEGFDWLSKNL